MPVRDHASIPSDLLPPFIVHAPSPQAGCERPHLPAIWGQHRDLLGTKAVLQQLSHQIGHRDCLWVVAPAAHVARLRPRNGKAEHQRAFVLQDIGSGIKHADFYIGSLANLTIHLFVIAGQKQPGCNRHRQVETDKAGQLMGRDKGRVDAEREG